MKRLQEFVANTKRLVGRGALVLGLATASGTAVGLAETMLEDPKPAYATSFVNDYPNLGAAPYNASAYEWWVDENGNGQADVTADPNDNDETMSSRGYFYRNCTDGAAYWALKYTGVTLPVLGNAKDWDNNASANGYTVKGGNSNGIEPGDIAQSDDGTWGHVGFVTKVTKNASGAVVDIETAELNAAGTGTYSLQTYNTKNASGNFVRYGSSDWDHFIDLNGLGKGINGDVIAGNQGSPTLARPAAIVHNGALNVFIRGGDGQIYNQYWNGTNWTGYSSIGGNMQSDPALIINNGALNVFAIGGDGQVYTKYNGGSGWSGWSSMGATTMKGHPRVVQYGGEIDVVALGTNNQVYKNIWNGSGWGGFSSLGGSIDSSPTALQYGSELTVVARGTDNAIYKDTWNGNSWGGFSTLGGSLAGNPDALTYSGQYDIWSISSGGGVWKRTWGSSGWSGWTWMGDGFHGNPDAMQYNSDLEVFARGSDGKMYTRYWSASGQNWSGWASIDNNKQIAGDPTAIQYGQELDVFVTGTDGKTYKNTFQPSSGWGGFTALPG